MIEIETQSYAGSWRIYKGIGELYGGLWCLPFTFHFLGVRAEHLRQLGHTFVWLPRSRERDLDRRMPWIDDAGRRARAFARVRFGAIELESNIEGHPETESTCGRPYGKPYP
jgi:hypothetical protein